MRWVLTGTRIARFWIIALPLMVIVIPIFAYPDLRSMVRHLQKRLVKNKISRVRRSLSKLTRVLNFASYSLTAAVGAVSDTPISSSVLYRDKNLVVLTFDYIWRYHLAPSVLAIEDSDLLCYHGTSMLQDFCRSVLYDVYVYLSLGTLCWGHILLLVCKAQSVYST